MQKVVQYIERHKLCSLDDKILVALRGGSDSVALLRLLLSLGYTCDAAHCNFHLRGAESDRDEAFVRNLCDSLGVRLTVSRADVLSRCKRTGESVEEAARVLPRINVITRALGVDENLDVEYAEGEIDEGEGLLLCSD